MFNIRRQIAPIKFCQIMIDCEIYLLIRLASILFFFISSPPLHKRELCCQTESILLPSYFKIYDILHVIKIFLKIFVCSAPRHPPVTTMSQLLYCSQITCGRPFLGTKMLGAHCFWCVFYSLSLSLPTLCTYCCLQSTKHEIN